MDRGLVVDIEVRGRYNSLSGAICHNYLLQDQNWWLGIVELSRVCS